MEQFHLATNIYPDIAALFFDLLLAGLLKVQYQDASESNRRFRMLTVVACIGTAVNLTAHILLNIPARNSALHVLRSFMIAMDFTIAGIIAYLFFRYVDSYIHGGEKTTGGHVFSGIFLAYAVLMALNFLVPLVIGYDDRSGSYIHGPLYLPVGFGVPFLFIIASGGLVNMHQKILVPKQVVVMNAAYFTLLAVAVLQAIFGQRLMLIYYIGSLGLYMVFFSIESPAYRKLLVYKKKLEEAEKQSEEMNRQKTGFLAAMSHEIRTPMAGVLGSNELILRATSDKRIRDYARAIRSAGESLLSIINDVLDLSHIENGTLELHPREYHLGALLDDIGLIIENRAGDKGLQFTVEADDGLSDVLTGDDQRLRQVLINLLNNGVKYTPKGSVTLTVTERKYRPDEGRADDEVEFSFAVRDTGIGIREENLPHLFDSFERVDEIRNRHIEGTGLGLAIVKNVADAMHAEVHVESTYGKGSVFTFAVPQRLTGHGTLGDYRQNTAYAEAEHEEDYLENAKGHVLAVDDNAMNRKVIRSLLLRTGLVVDTASSGAECLELLKRNRYDVVLMDIMMPEMDGIETMKRAREISGCSAEELPFIALTANAIEGAREKYLAEGFAGYLSKPVRVPELEEMIRKFISRGSGT